MGLPVRRFPLAQPPRVSPSVIRVGAVSYDTVACCRRRCRMSLLILTAVVVAVPLCALCSVLCALCSCALWPAVGCLSAVCALHRCGLGPGGHSQAGVHGPGSCVSGVVPQVARRWAEHGAGGWHSDVPQQGGDALDLRHERQPDGGTRTLCRWFKQ